MVSIYYFAVLHGKSVLKDNAYLRTLEIFHIGEHRMIRTCKEDIVA